MPALPTVNSDNNAWGTELNAFLSVSINSDGTLKTSAVQTAIAGSYLAANGVSLSGTPSSGYVPTATSGTTATWQAQSGGGGASIPSIIYASGLTADSGTTDNTSVLESLELAAHNLGGAIIALPSSNTGAFGCNFTTSYTGITWWGTGSVSPASSDNAPTTFCGLNSALGTQTNVWNIANPATHMIDLDINAGTVSADSISASSFLAQTALYNNSTDTILENVSPRGGTLVSFWETSNAKRCKYHFLRPSQPIGSTDPTYYAMRTMTCSIVAGGFQLTITDGTHTFTSTDVGHQVSGTGITPGTYILTVNSTTNATISQQCATATGKTITEYQCDNTWLAGSDTNISNSVFNFGTKRLQGSGQLAVCHFTFTGTSGCCNTILEGGSTYQGANVYFDSSPAPADGSPSPNLCHTHLTSGAGTATASCALSNVQFFQNTTSNQQPMIVENDTSASINIVGGIVHAGGAQKWTCLVAMTWGANPLFQFQNQNVNIGGALATSGGQPVVFLTGTSPYSGSAYGNYAGSINFNYAGTYYGIGQTPQTVTTPPISATSYTNNTGAPMFLYGTFTTSSTAGTATLIITSPGAANYTLQTYTPGVSGAVSTLTGVVPPGWSYKFTFSNMAASPPLLAFG